MTVRQCAATFRPGLDQLFSDLEAGRNFLAAQQLFRLLENLVHRPLFHGWQFTVRARSGHHNSFLTELGISLDSRRTSRARDGSGSWRRESDSNRHRRLCRPLHDPSAIPPCLREREGLVLRIGPSLRNRGAGNESRTRDLNLGKVALYQLSYSRKCANYIKREPPRKAGPCSSSKASTPP